MYLLIIIISKQLWLWVIILNTNNLHTVIWFQIFLSNINSIWHIVGMLTDITTLSQSGPRSNGSEGMTSYSLDVVYYFTQDTAFGRDLTTLPRMQLAYSRSLSLYIYIYIYIHTHICYSSIWLSQSHLVG